MANHPNLEHSFPTKSYCTIFRRPANWYMKCAKHAEHPMRLQHTDKTETPRTAQQAAPYSATPKCQVSAINSNGLRKTSDQSQSSFCSLLPREIRLEIYKYVLGGRCLHLCYGDGIKRPYLCRYPCILEDVAGGWDHSMCWDQKKPSLDSLLPLLQSCRCVYVYLACCLTRPSQTPSLLNSTIAILRQLISSTLKLFQLQRH